MSTSVKLKIGAFLLVALLITTSAITVSVTETAADTGGDQLLFDEGNGATTWLDLSIGATIGETVVATLTAAGHSCTVTSITVTIDGTAAATVGGSSTGGSFTSTGTTGITVTAQWAVYSWSQDTKVWVAVSDLNQLFTSGSLAVGFYPTGTVPVETPDNPTAWTCIAGDATNSDSQTATLSSTSGTTAWKLDGIDGVAGSYSGILSAGDYAFVKFSYAMGSSLGSAVVGCFDITTGEQVWAFWYNSTYYETSTPLIVGNFIYVQSSNGQIYKFDWRIGPGDDNTNVTTFNGETYGSTTAIPDSTGAIVTGYTYADGPASMVCDGGAIYVCSSNGMIYCFDLDLSLIWSYQTGGHGYFNAPTVSGDYVGAGMYDGCLYVLTKSTGTLVDKTAVYQTAWTDPDSGTSLLAGQVSVPCFVRTGDGWTVFVSYSDGRGMSAMIFGVAVYTFDGKQLTLVNDCRGDFGAVSNYLTPYTGQNFIGVYFTSTNGIYRLDTDGNYILLNGGSSLTRAKSACILVNDSYLFVSCYSTKSGLYEYDLNGKIIGTLESSYNSYSMAPVTVLDGGFLCATDSGIFAVSGGFHPYAAPSDTRQMALWEKMALALIILFALVAAFWCVLRFALHWEHPFDRLRAGFHRFFHGEEYTHNTKNKHRLGAMLAVGFVLTLTVAAVSLCYGAETTLSPGEMWAALISSIQKGGQGLTYNEMLIYNSRLPRVLAAFGVGIGLAVAGCVYQAIIRNPLVDPYILGVSSGAGTLAIAVISFGFTLFGIFTSGSVFLTATAAMIGGLLAFGCTMLLAEKSGGSSTNYVLAGIVVGLVFSAVQTLMMVLAGQHVASALTWLYGSFSSITWEEVWPVLVPTIAISLVPLVWARELNLVLLGDDQAREMGLNVRRFNCLMLLLASVLTSICVAFCGIIGFVGLVIPHFCRMLLGGDHRLVLPASIAFGGCLMLVADLLSRVLMGGYELPVGAITTVIGVPVFIYLLIRRGRMYEG